MDSQKPAARALHTVRNLLITVAAYLLITGTFQFFVHGSIGATSRAIPALQTGSSPNPATVETGTDTSTATKSPGIYSQLRPDSLVVANDAYMGPRPHADTYANFTRLVDVCRGTLFGLERIRYVYDCMKYLSERQDDYFFLPSVDIPSTGHPNFVQHTESNIGTCNGPLVPYHIWWSGKSTWRVELFIKSYFHSQNVPCSRLNLWLDTDVNPNAVEDMRQDPGFARFLPFVERGDIQLREWKFPTRVLLQKGAEGEGTGKIVNLGDGVYLDEQGNEWLEFSRRQMTFLPVAISDAVRFVVLHYEGGVYCDVDNILLRDLRPFLIGPNHGFAERWAWSRGPWDYNTAIMSLHPNSSLSQHFLRGAVKMGINFHPYIIGRLVYKDGRGDEFTMFEDAFFDPIWGQFNVARSGKCTVPCLKHYGLVFLGKQEVIERDWESFEGTPLEIVDGGVSGDAAGRNTGVDGKIWNTGSSLSAKVKGAVGWKNKRMRKRSDGDHASELNERAPVGFAGGYDIDKDPYPPNNRTLENFFRGSFAYHVHNQWAKHPEPNSWLDIVRKTHDGFLAGNRVNMYGEKWTGPRVTKYDKFPEFE